VQRIKSEGDFDAARNLVEGYGVKIDRDIHDEVLARWKKLNIATFAGFLNPKLLPVYEGDEIVDVKIEYPDDFTTQMLEYGKRYGFLPLNNK
jgi:dipeptidyl-peptidase-3